MKHLAAIQSQLALNKSYIKFLEEEIIQARAIKRQCDEEGLLYAEYNWHNTLKRLRAELKGYVKIQQALKQLCKGNV